MGCPGAGVWHNWRGWPSTLTSSGGRWPALVATWCWEGVAAGGVVDTAQQTQHLALVDQLRWAPAESRCPCCDSTRAGIRTEVRLRMRFVQSLYPLRAIHPPELPTESSSTRLPCRPAGASAPRHSCASSWLQSFLRTRLPRPALRPPQRPPRRYPPAAWPPPTTHWPPRQPWRRQLWMRGRQALASASCSRWLRRCGWLLVCAELWCCWLWKRAAPCWIPLPPSSPPII